MRYRIAEKGKDDTKGFSIGDWIIYDDRNFYDLEESSDEEMERPMKIRQMLVSKTSTVGEITLLIRDEQNREYYYADGVFRKATDEEIEEERLKLLFR